MTNGQQGEKLITEILRSVAHEYAWPDFQPARHTLVKQSPEALTHLEGTYVEFEPDHPDGLRQRWSSLPRRKLQRGFDLPFHAFRTRRTFPGDAAAILYIAGDTSFCFEKNEKGIVDRCIIVSGMKEREAKKIVP